ncbi:MAG: glycoside hydrolase family 2 TIM barrel-domain containing protein [Caldilinea sp.]|uniref:glycoside hydrolase family 2 TIM barrel-domain containing protein n=1 Tax=Caldilinea sp. TaxID=2293560 RepID=UPI00309D9DD5
MRKQDFNREWRFCKEGRAGAQIVDLPHDAMLHDARDPNSPGGSAVGFFIGGVYVYEKTFLAPVDWRGKCVIFEFEGVYRNSKVYLNGQEAGGRPYGYSRFFVHADPFLLYGAENTIRVAADNSQMPNSRWYSGSGVYRPVYLHVLNRMHIELDGVKVSTLSYAPATILVETRATGGAIAVEILDGDNVIARGEGAAAQIDIPNAKLWSAETPHLYRCRVTLRDHGEVVDEVIERFGVRKVEWSPQGLFINGQETLLRGGCIHHDNGVLGACTYAKAEERRIRILKGLGFNAIRSAHNPASKALLEACDRYGMYVIDEAFDMWYMHKNKYDYASDFDDWHLEDLKAMVEKDFNHPSVIMYSIGNEMSEPYQERGVQLTREMVDYLHSLDRNRAVTAGVNLMMIHLASKGKGIYKEGGGLAGEDETSKKKKPSASGSLFFNMLASVIGTRMNNMANSDAADRVTSPCLDALDIAGYNYASGRYKLEGKKHPNRVIYGSETFPQDIAKNWEMVKRFPYLVGDFMWTAWDYLGEAGLGAWANDGTGFHKPYPWLLAGCGAVDILGNVDAAGKYAAVVWGVEKRPYIGVRPVNRSGQRVTKAIWRGTNALSSWSWKHCEGKKAEIEVYADAHAVELFLNGKSLGKKKIKAFKAMYKTRYAPGVLKALAYDRNGRKLSESELVSATGKMRLALKPEESAIQVGELLYVNVELVGENGVVESNGDRKLTVYVEGGKLLGFGSANPCTEERFDSGSYTTYYGRALAVVQGGETGEMTIRVSGDGLEPAEATIRVTE